MVWPESARSSRTPSSRHSSSLRAASSLASFERRTSAASSRSRLRARWSSSSGPNTGRGRGARCLCGSVGTRLFLRITGARRAGLRAPRSGPASGRAPRRAAAELLAALPEARELLELDLAALEPLDDRLELGLVLLEARCSRSLRPSLPRAPKAPPRDLDRELASRRRRLAHEPLVAAHDRVAALERARGESARSCAARRLEAGAAALELAQRRPAQPLRVPSPAARRGARRPRAAPRLERRAASARARPRSSARSGTTSRPATDGVEARTSAARSTSETSCSWPTALTTGTGQARDGADEALVGEGQQVFEAAAAARDHDHVDAARAELGDRRLDRARRRAAPWT